MNSSITFQGETWIEEIDFYRNGPEVEVIIANTCCGCCGSARFVLTSADIVKLKEWLGE